RDRVEEVMDQVLDACIAEAFAGLIDHRRRPVEGDDAAPGEPLEELRRHLTRSAPGVEHAFVAGQVEPADDRLAPAGHGYREAVVRACAPGPRHRRALRRVLLLDRGALAALDRAPPVGVLLRWEVRLLGLPEPCEEPILGSGHRLRAAAFGDVANGEVL